MYAIVMSGGKQYKVSVGDTFDVEKLDASKGDTVDLDVLMLAGEGETIVDPVQLEGKKVRCEVIDQYKAEKVLVFKLKKRKRYHRTRGHRQNLTKLQVVSLPA